MAGAFRGQIHRLTSHLLPFLFTSLSNRINAFKASLRLQTRRLFSSYSFEINSDLDSTGQPRPSLSEEASRCQRSGFAPTRHANGYRCIETLFQLASRNLISRRSAVRAFDEQVRRGPFFHPTSLFRAPTSSRLIGRPRLAPQRRQSASTLVRPADSNQKKGDKAAAITSQRVKPSWPV